MNISLDFTKIIKASNEHSHQCKPEKQSISVYSQNAASLQLAGNNRANPNDPTVSQTIAQAIERLFECKHDHEIVLKEKQRQTDLIITQIRKEKKDSKQEHEAALSEVDCKAKEELNRVKNIFFELTRRKRRADDDDEIIFDDCGLFALAHPITLAQGGDPAKTFYS